MNYDGLNNYVNSYVNLANAGTTTDSTIKLDSMVCPCCGKKLRLVDSSKNEFDDDDLYKVNESSLNENKLADYLLDIIETEARNIYEDELETNAPETDEMGNIIGDYGERFLYVNKDLKKIIKTKANMISNMVKHQGIVVSPFYIETELFQNIKRYGFSAR